MRKRIVAVALSAAILGGFGASTVALADPPKPPCQPGQQGNPEPGFKPGSCK
jgi:hypothetical protein